MEPSPTTSMASSRRRATSTSQRRTRHLRTRTARNNNSEKRATCGSPVSLTFDRKRWNVTPRSLASISRSTTARSAAAGTDVREQRRNAKRVPMRRSAAVLGGVAVLVAALLVAVYGAALSSTFHRGLLRL
jgi:hypothetical protein